MSWHNIVSMMSSDVLSLKYIRNVSTRPCTLCIPARGNEQADLGYNPLRSQLVISARFLHQNDSGDQQQPADQCQRDAQ